MSDQSHIQNAPFALDLEAGTYFWCTCGLSDKQPFCNGAHKAVGGSPMKFTLEEAKKVWLCGCKQSKNAPYCDGTHKSL